MKYPILVGLIFYILECSSQSYINSWESDSLIRIEYTQKDFFFNQLDLRGSNYLYGKNNGTAEFYDSTIDSLLLYGFKQIGIFGDGQKVINKLNINYDSSNFDLYPENISPQQVYLDNHLIKKLQFQYCVFSLLEARNIKIEESLTFRNCNFVGKFRLHQLTLPDTLKIFQVDLSKLEGDFDLHTSTNFSSNKIHFVSFWKTDISKINIHYENFKLIFPTNERIQFEEKVSVYQDLLNNFTKRGAIQSYEKLDKEFKKFKYTKDGKSFFGHILNCVDSIWWDYGYNKFLIIRNAVLLYFFFFLINIRLYKSLVQEVYVLDKFAKKNEEITRQYQGRPLESLGVELPYIFLYTGYIFWGWKLDMHAISVNRIGLFSYVLFQYLVGIVCLAYIANLIITK